MLFRRHIALGPPLPPTRGRVSLLVRAFLSTVAAVKENLRAPEWALGFLVVGMAVDTFRQGVPLSLLAFLGSS